MKIYKVMHLKDLGFWGGATWLASRLTHKEYDKLEIYLIKLFDNQPVSEASINDVFWHNPLEVAEILFPNQFKDELDFYNFIIKRDEDLPW